MPKNTTVNLPGARERGPASSGYKSRPRLGQHFLSDVSAAHKIVDALGDVSGSIVLEIGPGRGALTTLLAARAERLIAVELDRMMAVQLRVRFAPESPHVEILEADVLNLDFNSVLGPRMGLLADRKTLQLRRVKVVGNLPYYITSDILLKLFHFHHLFSEVVIMVQREVADRIAAAPGNRDYGMLTVTTQLFAQVEKLFDLPPDAFSPPPKVWSSVLRLRVAPRAGELGLDADEFQKFLRIAFGQKRKTLWNNLKHEYDEDRLRKAIREAHLRTDVRAEAMTLEELARVHRDLGQPQVPVAKTQSAQRKSKSLAADEHR